MRFCKFFQGLTAAAAVLALAPASPAGPPPSGNVFAADFNGDGKDDIALSGSANDQVRHLDGVTSIGTGTYANGGGSLALAGVGFLNNDSNADLVQQGGGTTVVRLSNATGTAAANSIFYGDGGGAWVVVAVCDVDNDGVDDVIAQGQGSALGAVRVTDVASGAAVHSFFSTAGGLWNFRFCADVNGDGEQDPVFVNSGAGGGSTTARANLSGGATAVFYSLGGGVWSPVGAGKTTGTGSDSLIERGSGSGFGFFRVRTLDSSGAQIAQGFIPNGGDTQSFVFAGDVNGDTREDLVLRAATTNRSVIMNADGISSTTSVFTGNAGGSAVLDQGANTNADGAVDYISILTGNVFIQTINPATSAVGSSNTLATSPLVLF